MFDTIGGLMSGHRQLTDKQLAARLRRAAASGTSPRAYCTKAEWSYLAVYARLNRAGLWSEIMAAKYAQPETAR
mgnify:CR=1 FL=1